MAGKISELSALTGAGASPYDLVEVVDVSDTSMAASGTNKRMLLSELGKAPGGTALTHMSPSAVSDDGYQPGLVYSFNGQAMNNMLNQPAGWLFLVPTVFAVDTTVTSMGFQFAASTTAERRFWLALYDDTNGDPAARLAYGEVVLPLGAGTGPKSITGLSVPVVANRLYWAGLNANYGNNGSEYWCNATGTYARFGTYMGSCSWVLGKNTGYTTPPDPCGTIDPGLAGYGAPFLFFTV